MATGSVQQVLDSSIDADGLSICTALGDVAHPRQGTIFNPLTFAAGVPVWFHRLVDGRYLALFRSGWSAATVGVDGPQSYSAHSEYNAPIWVTIDPATGAANDVSQVISLLDGARVLNGATSYRDFFFTSGTLAGVPHVAHYSIARDGNTALRAEELLPVINGVSFSQGCFIDGQWLVVYGTDSGGQLYEARKIWARIGDTTTPWLYTGHKGYLAATLGVVATPTAGGAPILVPGVATADLAPLTSGGTPIVANGPVSVARSRDMYFLAVPTLADSTRAGRIYKQRALDGDWKLDGSIGSLGDNNTYLGGGVYFQPQLALNAAPPAASLGAIAYLSSVKINGANNEASISTSWGQWSVTR